MAASVADSYSIQLEIVASMLANYSDYSTSLASQLKPSDTVSASRYLYRQPVQKWTGGTFTKYSANRGDMGAGTGPKFDELKAGFFDSTYNFEYTKEQMDYGRANGSAMADVVGTIMEQAFKQLDVYDNINLFGDGTGKLTAAASTGTSTTLTFGTSTDYLGVNRLFEGMSVDVWDSTGATKRANGPYIISDINRSTKVVTFSSAPTAMGTTDLIAIAGADAYGPSTLASFSSTWPGGGTSNAPGLTGDSWRHGLEYANDSTGANYYLGKLKSSFSQLIPASLAAGGAALTFSTVELLKNLLIANRDETVLDGLKCVVHMAQRAQLQDTVTAVSTFMRTSVSEKMIDVQPMAANEFLAAGITFITDKRANKSRVDGFNAKNWFRVEGHEAKWFDYGDGQKVKAVTSSSTGNALAAYEMKIVQKMDTGCKDPGASFFASGLAVPTNY